MPIYNADGEIIGSYDPELEEREAEEARWEREMELMDEGVYDEEDEDDQES